VSVDRTSRQLRPEAAPTWLKPLVDNIGDVPGAYRRRVPNDVLAAFTAANAVATVTGKRRNAAVLVLFSGPRESATGGLPDDADLLVTVRSSDLRNHAGQPAFPGGAIDADDDGPVGAALREANEETGLDPGRLDLLATLEPMFIPPSGFHVVPVLAYSPDPGPVGVVDPREAAIVARVPVRAFVNPENRLMVYRQQNTSRFAGPAFLLNQMLVWGFTGQVISALLDVAGWARPWNTDDVRDLDTAMALVSGSSGYGESQQ
jgi:8-oxo-dGTP pyrophosphatase MutT (NUDIX family)